MGGQRQFIKEGGFSSYLYRQVGETITANGIEGKIVEKYDGQEYHDGLPRYSNTSKVYLKLGPDTKNVEQARIYEKRRPLIDIDWGHGHNGFRKGVAHVHEWEYDSNGNLSRTGRKRYMNNGEIRKYGALLKKACPDVKFR